MFGRSKLFAVLIVMTAALPYLLSSSRNFSSMTAGLWPAKSDPAAAGNLVQIGNDPQSPDAKKKTATTQLSVHPLEEVLRFDVTSGWVLASWPRVSADLAELDVQGYRVPLVSGTTDSDVAGSLTYYFNSKQRVERITLFGTTGDARNWWPSWNRGSGSSGAIVPEPNLFVYQVKAWGKVTSELRIRPAPVVRSEIPKARFEVALLLDRPSSMD